MVALIVPFVFSASTLFATPPPTLPPEIGHVTSRSSCVQSKRTLAAALPILIHNDNIIGNTHYNLGKLDSTQEASTILTITRTRTASSQIFKNLELAKNQIMRLHVLAAASTNADDSARYSAAADALDSVVEQQNTVADTFNGFSDTADMGLLYRGGETERKMNASNGPTDTTSRNLEAQRMKSGADVNVGALTTNVYRDLLGMRSQLSQTEQQVTVAVKNIAASCGSARKP